MVFNVTFNNISTISWWSGLLEGKPEYPAKTIDLPQIIDKLYHGIEYTSPWATFELTTLEAIGIDCKGSCNSNYHTSTTAPLHHRRQDNKRANSYYKNIPFSVMLNVQRTWLECGIPWVRFLVGSNQIYIDMCCFVAKHPSLKNRSKG
jgi:hypothetical protein